MADISPLRQLRLQRGLTLDAVAVLSGVDISTLSRVERGISKARPETIVRLAKALGVSALRVARLAEVDADPVTRDDELAGVEELVG